MNNKAIFLTGITGVIVFVATAIIGGLLIDNYSVTSQYISETYAIDTEYGWNLRIFGYIPSGILFTLFCFLGVKYLPSSAWIKTGFYGVGLFYGIGTIIVSVFPCDSGCNPDYINPSISQMIHNLSALMVYVFVPISILITGLGLKKFENYKKLSLISIALGVLSFGFVYILSSNLESKFVGLYQRIVESLILVWILLCAFQIKQKPYHRLS